MEATVEFYSPKEGHEWIRWPWPTQVKPSNPELLTWAGKKAHAHLHCRGHWTGATIIMPVHAIKLDNGRIWDSYNGFRDGGGPA